jgi:uncharacterized protein (TIGR00730 family)
MNRKIRDKNSIYLDSWSLFKIMADFVKGYDELDDIGAAVTVFGSARLKEGTPSYQHAMALGRKLADSGYSVITGGSFGIMEAANRGAKISSHAESIGLNIDLPHEQEGNGYLDRELKFDYFFVRKVMLVRYSLAYIAMPGGFGTMDELFEILTLIQTKKSSPGAVILVGHDYWKKLYEFMQESMMSYGTINQKDLDLIHIVDDIDEVVQIVDQSLHAQLQAIEEMGLVESNYGQMLKAIEKERGC